MLPLVVAAGREQAGRWGPLCDSAGTPSEVSRGGEAARRADAVVRYPGRSPVERRAVPRRPDSRRNIGAASGDPEVRDELVGCHSGLARRPARRRRGPRRALRVAPPHLGGARALAGQVRIGALGEAARSRRERRHRRLLISMIRMIRGRRAQHPERADRPPPHGARRPAARVDGAQQGARLPTVHLTVVSKARPVANVAAQADLANAWTAPCRPAGR